MSGDGDLVSRVRAALAHIPDVEEKKMFGSLGFMVHGKLCVGARPERIMCRIDPALHDAVLENEGSETVVMRGREYRGYVYVAAEVVSTREALKYWIDLALDYNKSLTSTTGNP